MDTFQKVNIRQVDQKDTLKLFLKGQPQTLGVAQILIALTKVYLWVIALSTYSDEPSFAGLFNVFIHVGYPVWGSLFFFLSGALSIAAGRKVTLGLIRSSLAMNVVSAVVAGIGTIMTIFEVIEGFNTGTRCLIIEALAIGIVLLSLLEASIAISLSVFGCNVACFVTQVVIVQSTGNNLSSATSSYAHVYEELEF